jgi:hypothetical protein
MRRGRRLQNLSNSEIASARKDQLMAEAAPSPTPKAVERIRRHHVAVVTLAQREAKKVVLAQIRSQGLKVHQFSAKDLTLLAEAELERNRVELITEAIQVINTSADFARLRCTELGRFEQSKNHCARGTSDAHNSRSGNDG